jgi:hypothetical protein
MKKITILLLTAAAMASGCKRFTDINQNPNQPTSVTPNVVLSAALASSGGSMTTFFNVNEWMGYWSRSGNYIAVQSTEQYQLNTGYADGDFQNLYGTLSKYDYMEKTALASPVSLAFYAGVAKTMKAVHFENLVDAFGNIPYSQAFNILKHPTPSYDDAQAIYDNLVTQLDSAVIYFNAAATYYGSAPANVITTDDNYDIMFGRGKGSSPATRMAKWIAFANTVKLKILMTESQVSGKGSYITAEIAKITANGGGFLTPGTSAAVNPGYGTANQAQVNPFYGAFYTNGGNPQPTQNFYRANTYAVNFYNATADTYRPQLVYVPVSGTSIGSNYDGDPASVPNSSTSGIGNPGNGGVLFQPSQDQLILSDFESLFLQAEAVARGYLSGDANALLQSAIEQNFIYLQDNAADADTYYASTDPNVNYAASIANPIPAITNADHTPGLQAIMTQKWIALNGINWFQAWTDYRRTQIPLSSVLGISHAQTHVKNAIPYRELYPLSEYDTNGKNVPTLANGAYTPLFWDKFEK